MIIKWIVFGLTYLAEYP